MLSIAGANVSEVRPTRLSGWAVSEEKRRSERGNFFAAQFFVQCRNTIAWAKMPRWFLVEGGRKSSLKPMQNEESQAWAKVPKRPPRNAEKGSDIMAGQNHICSKATAGRYETPIEPQRRDRRRGKHFVAACEQIGTIVVQRSRTRAEASK